MTSTLNDSAVTNNNSYTFTVTFSNPCATYTEPSDASDYVYKIGTGPYTFDVPAWTKGDSDCSYSDTLTFSPALSGNSWISVTGRTVKVVTGDLSKDAAS